MSFVRERERGFNCDMGAQTWRIGMLFSLVVVLLSSPSTDRPSRSFNVSAKRSFCFRCRLSELPVENLLLFLSYDHACVHLVLVLALGLGLALSCLALSRDALDYISSGGKLKRIVYLSSIGVERKNAFPFVFLNTFGVLDAKVKGEEIVKT